MAVFAPRANPVLWWVPRVNPSVASWLPTLFFVPLAAFGLYRRAKRTLGQQAIAPNRMALRMIMLKLPSA
jgi:hypothetical protein